MALLHAGMVGTRDSITEDCVGVVPQQGRFPKNVKKSQEVIGWFDGSVRRSTGGTNGAQLAFPVPVPPAVRTFFQKLRREIRYGRSARNPRRRLTVARSKYQPGVRLHCKSAPPH